MSADSAQDSGATYLDSSAIVKLVVAEAESAALLAHLRTRSVLVSSALARVEVIRAVRKHGAASVARARTILDRIHCLALDDATLDAAAMLDPTTLRSLDAIHLAAALTFEGELGEIVTYDTRMAEAAEGLDVEVLAPA